MQNIGEEIAGEYLKNILGCDFLQYNFSTPDVQGEIDVIGINVKERKLYICEVATHLVTGLMYVGKSNESDNVNRFYKKFKKNIDYANKYFNDYEKHFMLWSPIVKDSREDSKNNQLKDILEIRSLILKETKIIIEPIINQEFFDCLNKLRVFAGKETKELKSPVMRMMQIEEKLSSHLKKKSFKKSA